MSSGIIFLILFIIVDLLVFILYKNSRKIFTQNISFKGVTLIFLSVFILIGLCIYYLIKSGYFLR